MDKLYLSSCSRCNPRNKKKLHKIVAISKKKGVKLQCLNCFHTKKMYTNFDKLKEEQTLIKSGGLKNE